jgi:hypothetical protein
LFRRGYVSLYFIAIVHADLGEKGPEDRPASTVIEGLRALDLPFCGKLFRPR